MTKKIPLVIMLGVICLLSIPNIANAQTGVMTSQKVYGGEKSDKFSSILKTSDGGYVAVGESYSTTIATNGFGDGIIVKYDKDGAIEWQKNYGGSSSDFFNSVVAVDDGYVAVGSSNSLNMAPSGEYDGIIVKYKKNGDVEWQNNYGDEGHDIFNSVVATSDGGYVVAGRSNSQNIAINGSGDGIIVKYDKDGAIEWQKNYGTAFDDAFNSVVATKDGGFVIVGENSILDNWTYIYNGIIIKYNKNGNVEWEKEYGDSDNGDYFYSVVETSDGEFVAVGLSGSPSIAINGGNDGIIVKYDKDGNIKWQKAYGGTENDAFNSVVETSDGGFVAVGESLSPTIVSNDSWDGIIVKYDKDGNIKWQKNYGGSDYECFSSVAITEDDKYMVVGKSDTSSIATNGNFDAIALIYADESNVSIAPVTNGTVSSSNTTALTGETITLTINPASNYRLKSVKILKASNDSDVTTNVSYNATNKTFTMPSYDVEVNVEFEKIPYTITANNVTGATITPNGTINVFSGDNKEIEIIANTGYRLKKVLIDNVEQTLPLANNKITLTNITKNIVISVEVEEIIYTFDDDSKNKTYTKGTNTDLSLRVKDTNIENFDKVYINNALLGEEFFEVETGSIVITLKSEYLENLENETYNLKITTKDGGQATTTFVVANSQVGLKDNPKTGDGIMNSILLCSISIIGILGCGLFLNKKKRYN